MHRAPWTVRVPLPGGDLGTWTTLRAMRDLARMDQADPLVVQTAHQVVAGWAPSPYTRLMLLRRWLESVVLFQADPDQVELVRSPVAALLEVREHGRLRGDCDDVATLGASMALALGVPARYRVIGWDPRGPYSHVYAEGWGGHGWVDLDVTRPAQALGGLAGVPPAREGVLRI